MPEVRPAARAVFAILLLGAGCDPLKPDTGDTAAEPDGCAGVAELRETCTDILPDRFDVSTTVEPGCWHATATPTLAEGITLTLSPGVTILFDEDKGLRVSGTQVLVAQGTAEAPICLSGIRAERDLWNGVKLDGTTGDPSLLDHVTIEYAGNTTGDTDPAAVKATADSRGVRLSITNSTLRESGGWGLWLTGSAEVGAFQNNVLTANTMGPASVDAQVADVLDAGSRYTGNDVDRIQVRAYQLDHEAAWGVTEVPYALTAGLKVYAPWTLAPGVTIMVADDTGITISGDDASLTARGTAEQAIRFTGATEARGAWGSLAFDGSVNDANVLEHVIVEYGGSGLGPNDDASVTLTGDSHGVQVSISDCTFRESGGFGLMANAATLPVFENNVMEGNVAGPLSIASSALHQIGTTSSFTGNDVDEVAVRSYAVDEQVTWPWAGVPYRLDSYLHVWSELTLSPGITLIMPEDALIDVNGDEAALTALGTTEAPVTFTAYEATPGYWNGIEFDNSVNPGNTLAHVVVEYAGGVPADGAIDTTADSHGVTVSVTDSVIRESAACGIFLTGSASYNDDIESTNTFSNNAGGDVCWPD